MKSRFASNSRSWLPSSPHPVLMSGRRRRRTISSWNRPHFVFLIALACSGDPHPARPVTGRPGTIPLPDPRVGAAAQSACLVGDTLLRRIPGTTVRWSPATPFDSLWHGPSTRWACHLAAIGKIPEATAAIDSLLAWLKARGWVDSTTISADGPDGTILGVRWRGVTCLVEGRWDGGDDADTPTARSDTVEVHLACTPTVAGDLPVP